MLSAEHTARENVAPEEKTPIFATSEDWTRGVIAEEKTEQNAWRNVEEAKTTISDGPAEVLRGDEIAIHAIRRYLARCTKFENAPHMAVPYETIEEGTRDHTGKGWTAEMYENTMVRRWNDVVAQDTMYATTVTHLVKGREIVRVNQGVLQVDTGSNVDQAVDVLKSINDWHTENMDAETPITPENAPGLMIHLDAKMAGGENAEGNIFSTDKYLRAVMRAAGDYSLPAPDTEGTASLARWIGENVPTLHSDAELHFYGFKKVDSPQPFVLDSPMGYWPVIPVYVGDKYSDNVRGGIYLERHAPIHLWTPTHANTGGFVLVMINVDDSPRWYRGWRVTSDNPMRTNAPSSGKYKLAKINIAFGETLLAHPFSWHADATLSGGVFLTSFGFGPGPNGESSDETAATGFQPIVVSGK